MRDYVRFGWRACFASIGFDLVSLAVVFFHISGCIIYCLAISFT